MQRSATASIGDMAGRMLRAGASAAARPFGEAPKLPSDRAWLTRLVEPLPDTPDGQPIVEGRLPEGLRGTLYRNGPGLFERNGFRKGTIVDGDGLIRATTFADGIVRFRARYVRTAKFDAEEAKDAFLDPTWTTRSPRLGANIPCTPRRSQAGVTPVVKNGVLYAFDEVGVPYGLDPDDLRTTGEIDPGAGAGLGPLNYKAHTKTDGRTGDWILVGQRGQAKPTLHAVVKDRTGRQVAHQSQPSPRGAAYFHDFFWAGPYVVFHLHPAMLQPLPMLVGLRSYGESLRWRPEQGSRLVVVDTTGASPPIEIDVPACWMWHSLNAYARGRTIIGDFVGYDAPDHFIGPTAAFRAIMQGRDGTASSPGTMRRLVIDLDARRARLETLFEGHYEFPFVPQHRAGHEHRFGYVASRQAEQGWFHDGVARLDTVSGAQTSFHFGPGHYVGEPVFVPDSRPAPEAANDRGWLIAEVLEGASATSFLAVFEAGAVDAGPVARVRFRNHLTFSFHGWWEAA